MAEHQLFLRQLEEELAILEELNGLSLLKKDAIMNDDLNSLETIVLKEEALSKKLSVIDHACSPQVQFFLRDKKNGSEAVTNLLQKVRESVRKLRLNNELNQGLIEDALGITQLTLNMLLPETKDDPAVYGSGGKVISDRKKNQVLDYKG